MTTGTDEPPVDASATVEVHPTTLQAERSLIPDALQEDRVLVGVLESEVVKRQERLATARASLGERRTTLWQAQTRQDTARRLYVLSKNMMEQIRQEGQLKGPPQNPRDSTSRHGRSLSSMDQSRQALVDRTVVTLRDAIAELQAASSDLVIAQKNVGTAEAFVGYSERSLEAMELQMRLTRAFLGEEEMKTRPTPNLPEDVWKKIFLVAVVDESELPTLPQDIFSEWEFRSYAFPLSHVNREWRRIATSTSALWTGVQIVFTREKRLRPHLFKRIVGLAGSSPLRIAITLTSDVGSLASQLASAFTEDHVVRRIKIQCTDYAAPGVRNLLEAIPAAQHLNFKGLTIPMATSFTPIKIPSKHVMSASTVSVSDLVLERLPPFFFVPSPPWNLHTLHTDIPSLLRIDIGGNAQHLQTLVIYQPLSVEHGPPWYETTVGLNVEGVAATDVVIHSMSRGHIGPLLRYISRLRFVTKLELYGASVQPILAALKDNIEGSGKVWLPSLSNLVVNDYEQHGQALGLFVAARLDLAQRSLTEDIGVTVQPLQQVDLIRCTKLSEDIVALIEQHCQAGRTMARRLSGEDVAPPQSA